MVRADGGVSNVEETTRVQGAARKFFNDVGISQAVQERIFATDPNSIYFLTSAEMTETGITFVRGSPTIKTVAPQLAAQRLNPSQREALMLILREQLHRWRVDLMRRHLTQRPTV
jgi:hypothetical protein